MSNKYAGMTAQEKYDILTKDFLERDGDRFVRIRTNDRIGWENTLPEGAAYSEAILSPKDERELYLRAMTLARNMIVAMNPPCKVNVRVNPNNRNSTDGKNVYVATNMFDDPELQLGQKLDTFLGCVVHEGSHLLYTDFSALETNNIVLVHHIANILEDEHIERKLGEEKPGLANFLKATKYYYYGKYKAAVGLDTATRLFNSILSLVRYPASLDPNDVLEFADTLLKVRDILTPYPDSTEKCMEKAKEIYELLKQAIPEEEKRNQQKQDRGVPKPQDGEEPQKDSEPGNEEQGQGKQEKSEKHDKEDEKNQDGEKRKRQKQSETDEKGKEEDGSPAEGAETEDKSEPKDARQGKEDTQEEKEENGTEDADTGEGEESEADGEPSPEPLTDEEIAEIIEAVIKALGQISKQPGNPDSSENQLGQEDVAKALKKDGNILAKEMEGELELGHEKDTIIVHKETDQDRYAEAYNNVRKYIPGVAKALTANASRYEYITTGMRSGLLDTNKLTEARQGVQNVYMHKGEVKSEPVNVALVIDESGSMEHRREKLARETAVLINAAVGQVPNIRLYIYGYTSTRDKNILFPYVEGRPKRGTEKILGSITAIAGTPTAEAMREAAWRISRNGNKKTLMFILSDGCANTGPEPVRKATDDVSRMGFQVVGVSISSSLNGEQLKRMYDNYIEMDEIENLATELGKVIKKAVLNASKRKIS